MKKILLTTDLSEESRSAFEPAKEIAQKFGADITLLAIIEDPAQAAMVYAMDYPVAPDSEVQQQLKETVNKELKGYIDQYFADIDITHELLEAGGPVDLEMIKYAKENSIDLIVMATHGRTGLSRLLIGSITEKVVRNSNCPVLIVPVKAKK